MANWSFANLGVGGVKFEKGGVTELVTTSELLHSALLPDKFSHVSRQGHLVILRGQFNIILRPQGISTYCKAVRLCLPPPPLAPPPSSATETLSCRVCVE